MPLEKLYHDGNDRVWALWKINEDETWLANNIAGIEAVPEAITSETKRLEFLAARVLVKEVATAMNMAFTGIHKDDHGKPYFAHNRAHLSLSHSYPFVAVLVDRNKAVGIDIEQPKAKLLRIASRILREDELHDAGDNVVKHCVYWCAKETLIKIHGKKDLIFAENLIVSPFLLRDEGEILGRIIVDGRETAVPLHYNVTTDFVLVRSN